MFELRRKGVVFLLIKQNQEISYCTENAKDVLGYTSNELIGLPITVLMDKRKAAAHQHYTDNFIKNGRTRPEVGRFEVIKRDGSKTEVDVWIPDSKHIKISDEIHIPGMLWNSSLLDEFNTNEERIEKMLKMGNKMMGDVYENIDQLHATVEKIQKDFRAYLAKGSTVELKQVINLDEDEDSSSDSKGNMIVQVANAIRGLNSLQVLVIILVLLIVIFSVVNWDKVIEVIKLFTK